MGKLKPWHLLETFEEAVELHQQGRIVQAETLYRAILGTRQSDGSGSIPEDCVSRYESLGRYGWREIEFMKIDAEGEEASILKGGERFFAELSPLVLEVREEVAVCAEHVLGSHVFG